MSECRHDWRLWEREVWDRQMEIQIIEEIDGKRHALKPKTGTPTFETWYCARCRRVEERAVLA